MKRIFITLSITIFSIGITNVFYGQNTPSKEILNWYNGTGAGMHTEKAYKQLEGKKSTTVIVAVIDSGIDIEHKDLEGKIWTNEKEIPNNGIDDDNNGYIDDIHGWNFLGNSKGENVNQANLEKTRILRTLSVKFKDVDPLLVSASDQSDFKLYQKVKLEVETEKANYVKYIEQLESLSGLIDKIPGIVSKMIGIKDYTEKDLENWKTKSQEEDQIKGLALDIFSGRLTKAVLDEQMNYINDQINYYLNVDFNERTLIGDNPNDFSDTHYGNNDVEGPEALHGTHVGGIIGAIRGNNLGGDGVAENVKLMVLRAVPNGDENDKDIALAIRYAVDNGAKVINMSFGKPYSPHQKEVFEAFKYADSKGVLLIHAAGNDNANVDTDPNFPTSLYSFQAQKLDLFLTIGASTSNLNKDEDKGFFSSLFVCENYKTNHKLPADFSNYGQTKVDVFAPGSEIYNSVPQSEYKILQGTSMAAPMVAGVAALLASYFPNLTMNEIKNIILKSATSYKGRKYFKPGTEELVDFASLSVTGGIVNVENAVKMCLALEATKK